MTWVVGISGGTAPSKAAMKRHASKRVVVMPVANTMIGSADTDRPGNGAHCRSLIPLCLHAICPIDLRGRR